MTGPLPWTIVRATQFCESPEMVLGWTRHGDTATIAPLLVQPIASSDVAQILMDVALGDPAPHVLEAAGPERQNFVDMARRVLTAKGDTATRLIPSWHDGPFGPEMAGDVLLPGPDATLGHTTFADWLATLSPHDVTEPASHGLGSRGEKRMRVPVAEAGRLRLIAQRRGALH